MGWIVTQVNQVVKYCSCSIAHLSSILGGERGSQAGESDQANSVFSQLIRMLGSAFCLAGVRFCACTGKGWSHTLRRVLSLLLLRVGGTLFGL